mgnify:CR=1 FL=1
MIIDVFFDESVFICQGKECSECAPIASSGVLRKLEFIAMDSFCSGEVFTESVAEVYCEVVKRAVASCVVLELLTILITSSGSKSPDRHTAILFGT